MEHAPFEPLFDAFPPISAEAWERKIRADLRDRPYDETLLWTTPDGFTLRPYYRAEDLESLPHMPSVPKTAGNAWQIRQDITVRDVQEANRRARTAIQGGAETVGFALPSSEMPDLARLLDGLDLARTPLHFTGSTAGLLDALLDEAARRGVDAAALRGSVAAAAPSTRASGIRTLCASAEDEREGDTTPAGTITALVARAADFLGQWNEQTSVEAVCRQMHLTYPVGPSYFVEIAALRALRMLLALVVDAYAPGTDADHHIHVHAATARSMMTADEAETNLLRGTTAAAAAVLGGCDSLTVRPFDLFAGGPTTRSLRLARNTQLILRHEAHFDKVADPAAGAYYVEVLTDRLAHAAWNRFTASA